MTAVPSSAENSDPPGRRTRLLVTLLLLPILGTLLWWGWQGHLSPPLPKLRLEGVDPEVATAVRRAEDGVRNSPHSATAWGELGMVLLANKLEQESVEPLAHAEELDPAEPRWTYLRGIALLGRDPDQALPCLRRAAMLCQVDQSGAALKRAAAHLRLAETLAANGHAAEAETHFQQVATGPLSPCAAYGLGALATVRGDLAVGKRHFVSCLDSPLTRHKAAAQLAVLARRLGEQRAAEQGQQAGQLPADASWPDPFVQECLEHLVGKESRMQHAAALEGQGQVDRALDVLRGVARDYPDAQSFLSLGVILGRAGHFRESESYLQRSLELAPSLLRAQYYLSLSLFAQGEALKQQGKSAESEAKFDQAARWARQATATAPSYGEAHFQLGLTLWRLQRRDEALAAFRQAVATRPEMVDAHLWLGRVLAENGAKEEAVVHLRHAVRYASPNDPRPQQALAELLGEAMP